MKFTVLTILKFSFVIDITSILTVSAQPCCTKYTQTTFISSIPLYEYEKSPVDKLCRFKRFRIRLRGGEDDFNLVQEEHQFGDGFEQGFSSIDPGYDVPNHKYDFQYCKK